MLPHRTKPADPPSAENRHSTIATTPDRTYPTEITPRSRIFAQIGLQITIDQRIEVFRHDHRPPRRNYLSGGNPTFRRGREIGRNAIRLPTYAHIRERTTIRFGNRQETSSQLQRQRHRHHLSERNLAKRSLLMQLFIVQRIVRPIGIGIRRQGPSRPIGLDPTNAPVRNPVAEGQPVVIDPHLQYIGAGPSLLKEWNTAGNNRELRHDDRKSDNVYRSTYLLPDRSHVPADLNHGHRSPTPEARGPTPFRPVVPPDSITGSNDRTQQSLVNFHRDFGR